MGQVASHKGDGGQRIDNDFLILLFSYPFLSSAKTAGILSRLGLITNS